MLSTRNTNKLVPEVTLKFDTSIERAEANNFEITICVVD